MKRDSFVLGKLWSVCTCDSGLLSYGNIFLAEFLCSDSSFFLDCCRLGSWRNLNLNSSFLYIVTIQLREYLPWCRCSMPSLPQPDTSFRKVYICVNHIAN